ncbi:MAG: glycolate oxidase subunit GlcE [Gammaproteobacteria bacterium]|nr:glycolate oxidase subunit GlcE [Gammaproteobacteria bacterium]
MTDLNKQFIEQITQAKEQNTSLHICGGNSKSFLVDIDKAQEVDELSTEGHSGIINYLPSELTITVRSGTPLIEVQQALADKGQMLPFEPPMYDEKSTIGGVIASGLSGARRPFSGSVRDFVLGTEVINGKAELLRFGGEVMKNVAGYDVSRLMVGAQGRLGLISSVSLKVLPVSEKEQSIAIEMASEQFFDTVQQWMQQSYPLSAAVYYGEKAYFRFSASESFIEQIIKNISSKFSGLLSPVDNQFWSQINNQTHDFFKDASNRNLLKVLLPMYLKEVFSKEFAPKEAMQIIDWGGACRWLYTVQSIESIRQHAEIFEGTAQVFRDNGQYSSSCVREHPRANAIAQLEMRIQQQFDPQKIFNRHYAN